MDWGRLFFSAEGRIRRQDFWMAFLVLLGFTVFLGWLVPIWPIVLYCSICTRTKRLHDMGRTGWLQVIPAIGYTVAVVMSIWFGAAAIIAGSTFDGWNEAAAVAGVVFSVFTVIVVWFVAFLIDLGFLLWIGCSQGDADENLYGPAPLTVGDTHIARA